MSCESVRVAVLTAAVLLAACTTTKPVTYNPESLTPDQAAKIEQICREVMAFNPGAPEVDNAWPGDPDPARVTNGYRGCIASLSQSLLRSDAARVEMDADRACRGQGLPVGSSALAECVLKRTEASPHPKHAQDASLAVTPFGEGGSWARDTARREQQACVEIGLEPAGSQFASCVNGLQDVITAMQLGNDYRN